MLSMLFGLIIITGCNRKLELNTNLEEWKGCRKIAWNKCFGSDGGEKLNLLMNDLCDGESPNIIPYEQCGLLNNIHHNCWDSQAKLCDQQFNIEKLG